MGIIDIVFIVILIIAILVGLKKGLAGIFFGFVGFLILGIGLGFALKFTVPLVVFSDIEEGIHSSIGEKVYDPIYNALPREGLIGDILFTTIIKEGNNISFDTTITLDEEVIQNPSLEQFVISSLALPEAVSSIAAGFLAKLAKDNQTFAIIFANMLTIYAISTILWIVLAIIFTILKNIIRRRIFKWLDRNPTASKVDRGLGMATLVVLMVCIIWGAGLFVTLQEESGADWAVSANEYIQDESLVIKELNQANLFVMIVKGDPQNNEQAPND